jgi:hypothetical protein
MSTILVEARRDENSAPALDRIAATCRRLGHDVFRWRGPLSGRVPYWRSLFACDLAILWNGAHPRYARTVAALQARGTPVLYVELGWHPQRGTIQIDPAGVNARASWAAEPLSSIGRTPLTVRGGGDLLVVLQLDRDTQITQLSPWFKGMRSFVEFISRHSVLPVRVRVHPREPGGIAASGQMPAWGRGLADMSWDDSPTLAAALARAKAVACINSSCGVEALSAGLPLLCYGKAIYRHPGAVYCLTDDAAATAAATAALAAGTCGLFREPIDALVERIAGRQWTIDEIPARLPALLSQTLTCAARDRPSQRSWLAQLVQFTRDLPERWFVRRSTA